MNFLKELCSWSQLRWTKRNKKKGDMSYIGFGSNKMRTERRPWICDCLEVICALIRVDLKNRMGKSLTDRRFKREWDGTYWEPFKFWCKMKQIKSSPITLLKKKKKRHNSVIKMSLCIWWKLQFWPMLVLEMLQ